MKSVSLTALGLAVALQGTSVWAGGPVVIEDTEEVVAEKPATSIGILPILIGIVVICAIACDQDDETPPTPRL